MYKGKTWRIKSGKISALIYLNKMNTNSNNLYLFNRQHQKKFYDKGRTKMEIENLILFQFHENISYFQV